MSFGMPLGPGAFHICRGILRHMSNVVCVNCDAKELFGGGYFSQDDIIFGLPWILSDCA